MKILWFFLTLLFGLIGMLGLVRSVEILFIGAGNLLVQLGVALISILLAGQCLKKARSKISA